MIKTDGKTLYEQNLITPSRDTLRITHQLPNDFRQYNIRQNYKIINKKQPQTKFLA